MSEQTIHTTVRQKRIKAKVDSSGTHVDTTASPETLDAPQPDRVTKVVYAGRPGPPGAQGGPGPAGAPGGTGPVSYVHSQNLPAAVWTVTHNLGYRPAGVHVEDSAGTDIEGEIDYVDANTLTLTFTAAFGGVAYLS